MDTTREALTLIAGGTDVLAADEMLVELAARTGIHETAVREEFGKIKNKASREGSPTRQAKATLLNNEEQLLLSAVIAFPGKADYVLSKLDISDIKDKTVESLFRKLSLLGEEKDLDHILGVADEVERRIVTRLSVEPGFDPEHVDKNIEDCFRRIEERKLDARLRSARTSNDAELANSLLIKKRFTEGIGL